MSEPKQVLVVRKDLNMRKGKIAVQCAHASMKVILDLMETVRNKDVQIEDEGYCHLLETYKFPRLQQWLEGKFTKVCVSVDGEAELDAIYSQAKEAGLLCSLIVDSGATEFHGVPTKTVVAIGPDFPEAIDKITGHLKLL